MSSRAIFFKNTNKFSVFLLIVLCSIFISCFASSKTFAEYAEMPTELLDDYTNHLSIKENSPSSGEGLRSKAVLFNVYRNDASGSVRVYLRTVEGNGIDCNDFEFAAVPNTNDNNDGTAGTPEDSYVDCNSGDSSVLVKDNAFFPSERFKPPFEPQQRYVSTLRVKIKLSAVTRSPSFKVGSSEARLAYLAYPSDSKPNSDGEYQYGPGLSYKYGRGSITIRFAPACDWNSATKKFWWRDADSNKDANASPGDPTEAVTYRIFDDTDSQYSMSAPVDADADTESNGRDFFFRKNHRYHITFYNVKGSDGGDALANSIQMFLPFSSAGYYQDCTPPTPGWEVESTSNYIQRTSPSPIDYPQAQNVGDITQPGDGSAPQPGHRYSFINNVRNTGGREITNLRWTKVCNHANDNGNGQCNGSPSWYLSDSYLVLNTSFSPYSVYGKTAHQAYDDNTRDINFSRTRTGEGTNTWSAGAGTGSGQYIGGLGWVWDTFRGTDAQGNAIDGVGAGDGGRTQCVSGSFSPRKGDAVKTAGVGTTNWTVDSTTVGIPQLCVAVPHFFNLTLPGIGVDATVQQGSNVDVSGSVRETNEGLSSTRPHTNTKNGMERGIVEVKLTPGEPEPSPSISGANQVGQAPCDYMIARVPGSELATCTKDFNGSRATNPVAAGATETLNGSRSNTTEAVGTKYCYATYAQHPRHINNSDYVNGDNQYSYSNISCSVIVKSPKVHFLNNDLTVGRLRDKAADGSCVVSGAPIIARGVPDSVSANNLYGSWVSNGAFATGAINGFGSAAKPVGLAGGGDDSLTFGNQSGGLGRYSYSNCLPNPFGEIKDADSTDLASHSAFVLKADDPTTGTLTMVNLNNQTQDKTGYVSDGKSIEVGQKIVAPPPSSVPPDTVMTTVRINAKSVNSNPGNVSCPKMQVVVTGDNSSRDQDTKPVCSTAHQDYVYNFYLPTSGPKTIDVRFVNDSSGAGAVNRDIQIRTIAANNKNLYTGTTGGAAVPGVTVTMRGAAASKSSCRTTEGVLLDIVYGSNDDSYCYSSLVLGGGLDAPLATQNPSYVPPESKTIQVTAKGTSYNLHGGGGACPYMFININNGQRQDLQEVCETSESTYTFTTNTGNTNIDSIEVGFDPMDAWGGGQDRNLYVSNVRVGDANFAINQNSDSNVQFKNGNTFVSAAAAPGTCKNADTAIFMSATDNVTTGYCAVIRVNNVTPPTPPEPPVTPLDNDFIGFNGRDIVIYAKKTVGDTCNATSTGNITINQNIIYKRTGFTSLFDLPRVTFIADCNIIIDDAVTDVNASLIAGDAIKTCSKKATNKDQCNQTLLVKGNISANRLLLWRTHGADLSVVGDDKPGETFDISPAQVVSRYNRDQRSAKPTPTYEVDLPPRY